MKMKVFNVPVQVAAKLMNKNVEFLYMGLQQGIFPFGYAVKTSTKYSYYISSVKFEEYTGIKVNEHETV